MVAGGGGVVVTACRCGQGVGIGGVVVSRGRGEEKEEEEEEASQLRASEEARTIAQGSTMHIGRARKKPRKGKGGEEVQYYTPLPPKIKHTQHRGRCAGFLGLKIFGAGIFWEELSLRNEPLRAVVGILRRTYRVHCTSVPF